MNECLAGVPGSGAPGLALAPTAWVGASSSWASPAVTTEPVTSTAAPPGRPRATASASKTSAMDAARSGLRLAFNDEMLWRDLLTAAHATGQEHVLRGVVSEIAARVALDEVMPRMAPETEALIDELLPSWRTSAA